MPPTASSTTEQSASGPVAVLPTILLPLRRACAQQCASSPAGPEAAQRMHAHKRPSCTPYFQAKQRQCRSPLLRRYEAGTVGSRTPAELRQASPPPLPQPQPSAPSSAPSAELSPQPASRHIVPCRAARTHLPLRAPDLIPTRRTDPITKRQATASASIGAPDCVPNASHGSGRGTWHVMRTLHCITCMTQLHDAWQE